MTIPLMSRISSSALEAVWTRSRAADKLGGKIKEALEVVNGVLQEYGWVGRWLPQCAERTG